MARSTANEDERLVGFLDEADAALNEALPYFRRMDEHGALGIGAMPSALTPDHPDIVRVRDRVGAIVEPVARQILKARDRNGLPLDFELQWGNALGIGQRGGDLCSAWLDVLGGLEIRDPHVCVVGLERMQGLLAGLRRDLGRGASTADAGAQGSPPDRGEQAPTPRARLKPSQERAYRLFQWALEQNPDLGDRTDQEVYDWLAGRPDTADALPDKCGTWKRQLRAGRAAKDDRKHNPRSRRTGRGTARPDDL